MNELFVGSLARANNSSFTSVWLGAVEWRGWWGVSGAVPRGSIVIVCKSGPFQLSRAEDHVTVISPAHNRVGWVHRRELEAL